MTNILTNIIPGLYTKNLNMGSKSDITITRNDQHQVYFILLSAASGSMICFIAGNGAVKSLGDHGSASWSNNNETLTVLTNSTYRKGIILSSNEINYTLS